MKKLKKKSIVDVEKLSSLLNNVYLDGAIDECILEFKEKTCYIQAVNSFKTIFVYSTEKIKIDYSKEAFGIGNISLLIKYLSKISSEKLMVYESVNKLILTPLKSKSKFEFLLSDTSTIPNFLGEKSLKKKYEKLATSSIELSEEMTSEIILYSGFIVNEFLAFSIKEGYLICKGGDKSEHSFSINLGKIEEKDTVIYVNKTHLLSILRCAPLCTLLLGKGKPIIIKKDKNLWALNPLKG